MPKAKGLQIVRQVSLTRRDVVSRDVPTESWMAMRYRLEFFARKYYGTAWRMVDDPGCLFPFYVRATGVCDGETLMIE